MSAEVSARPSISTAIGRWMGIGPYYAMFPLDFAFEAVRRHSQPGGKVLDPFAGRASSIYAAATQGRMGYGIEISPVGWLYGQVKLNPAPQEEVLQRIEDVRVQSAYINDEQIAELPEFFSYCYTREVLRYLLAARQILTWNRDSVDATLMAIILVHLHGKRTGSLSNQMRQGKAMSPAYSIKWWQAHSLTPPEIDPADFLRKKVEWRYAKGLPVLGKAQMILGDSTTALEQLGQEIADGKEQRFDLLFTSPPYYAITDYHYDQWLRLWMLGEYNTPTHRRSGDYRSKFESKSAYQRLLFKVFADSAKVMSDDATIYIRTDARLFTHETTLAALHTAFPNKNMTEINRPYKRTTQTALFGDKSNKPGEVDIILK